MDQAAPLLSPKEITLSGQDGKERKYILSKFPAVQGREIISKCIASSVPQLEKYDISEETMLKMMAYVAVPQKNRPLRLITRELVDNHVPDWEILDKLEKEVIQYNCSFFLADRPLTFFDVCLKMMNQKASEILTTSLEPLLQTAKQPSTNSPPSTV
jgi:hypothetical protein